MKQIKLESLVKTDRTGTNEYGLWVIYDVFADGQSLGYCQLKIFRRISVYSQIVS